MFSYFGAARRLKKDLRACQNERDIARDEAARLRKKLDDRSDLFIEREFRLVDRFLTSQAKVPAITDEIASKITDQDVKDADLAEFLQEKKEQLVEWARDAGAENPEDVANATFTQQYDSYVHQFQAG